MKLNVRKIVTVLGLTAVLSAGGATAAQAQTETVEGGTWSHVWDIGYQTVSSNYLHPSRKHGSTACNNNSCQRSEIVKGGVWSFAQISSTWVGNKWYYRFG